MRFSYLEVLRSPCILQVQAVLLLLEVHQGQFLPVVLDIHRFRDYQQVQIVLSAQDHLVILVLLCVHRLQALHTRLARPDSLPALKRMFEKNFFNLQCLPSSPRWPVCPSGPVGPQHLRFRPIWSSFRVQICDWGEFSFGLQRFWHISGQPARWRAIRSTWIDKSDVSQSFNVSRFLENLLADLRTTMCSLFEISKGSFFFIVFGKIGRTSTFFSWSQKRSR